MAAEEHLGPQFYHGTSAQLQPGDMLHPNHVSDEQANNQEHPEHSDFVWMTNRLKDADWYARRRTPGGRSTGPPTGHVYEVEPTGLHGPAGLPLDPGKTSPTAHISLSPAKVKREVPAEERMASYPKRGYY